MNLLKENIAKISEEIAQKLGFFIVDIIFRGDQRKRIIEVFVDGEKNISADDLAQISREINSVIEGQNLIKESYRLDVSTPGVERPLKYLKQFPKHTNRNFEITYNTGDVEKTITGKLLGIKGEELTFLSEKNNLIVEFKNITKAKVLISFS
jgi:ribosome maturation factor RimP